MQRQRSAVYSILSDLDIFLQSVTQDRDYFFRSRRQKQLAAAGYHHLYAGSAGPGKGCRQTAICGPESARELLQHHEQIRVATKYPHIAKDYFYNKKHQTVEIIKLNGSIELAPIVGLSEVICDIVETGTTLKENGLTVLEEVCPLSARVVVNQVSMKMDNERITKLISDLKTVIK